MPIATLQPATFSCLARWPSTPPPTSLQHPSITRSQPDPHLNSPAATTPRDWDTRHIRQWAKDNGYDIADRGILPQKVIDAYNARA
ncbi:Lsr2 family protein [Corynebacterium diphtheriae bv. mitis]|nr:Lsr2 family protein [Corynebacterium diphtheriae bv. mitis]QBZ29795.1 hypothetical protein E4653_08110 [Corynebacterium diphtheriae subsp. lausannense]MBG9256630.1 Lsr2 family protein [Corynebacterium diphtheriae bv. mitis]MBG9358823.1 Lsr2 family protein [Corynebacterium diphtheriae bv. mitis]MBG9360542.1 Lsr2 family protein [Corynebacterium diphtheriae bv. mitis]